MPRIKPLSMTLDHSGDEPKVIIDGTNYAMNIVGGSVVVLPYAPSPTGTPQARVTVTFVVDDLRVLSRDAEGDATVEAPVRMCGGVINGPVTIQANVAEFAEGMRRAKRGEAGR